MNEFDDPLVRQALHRLAGYPPDDETAYALVRTRARTVRQRRLSIAAATCCAVFGVGLYAAVVRESPAVLRGSAGSLDGTAVATDPGSTPSAPPTAGPASSTDAPATMVETPVTGSTGELIPPAGGGGDLVTVPPVTATTDETAPPNESDAPRPTPGQPTVTRPSPPTTRPEPATTEPPTTEEPNHTDPTEVSVPRTVTESFEFEGGSLTVSRTGDELTLDSVKAYTGYSAAVDRGSGSSVRVRFSADDGTVTYRVNARRDGSRIVFEIQMEESSRSTSNEEVAGGSDELETGGWDESQGGDGSGGSHGGTVTG